MSARSVLLALAAAAPLAAQDAARGDAPKLVRSSVRVLPSEGSVALRDVDGDGDLDLVQIDRGGVGVRRLGDDGSYLATPELRLPWPAKDVAWMLVDLEADGRTELAAYVEGREVRVFSLDPEQVEKGSEDEGRLVLAFEGNVPRGLHRMSFFRDVDGDGDVDLVLPAFGTFAVHLFDADAPDGSGGNGGTGAWRAPLEVTLETVLGVDVGNPDALDSTFEQTIVVPWFSLEDVDGDGDVDLYAETEDAVHFHLAEPDLQSEPTWTLDLAALRAELPTGDDVDLSNLLSSATKRVAWELVELDGAPPKELFLQVGREFRAYAGGSRGIDGAGPPQIRRLSGNVLWYFLRDVQGDALPDLQVVRGETISLASVLRWLVLPGGIDLDIFTYQNGETEPGTFAKRPTRRNTLEVRIPRILGFMEDVEELQDELEEEREVAATRFAFGADGLANDVVDVREDELFVFLDCAPGDAEGEVALDGIQAILEQLVLNDLDALEDGGTHTFDFGDLDRWNLTPHTALREACDGRTPAARIPLEKGLESPEVHARDLDGDGRLDVIVVAKDGAGYGVAELLVRR